jgi:hypothetical protein
MPDGPPNPENSVPLFSVIIPLAYHRDQWERSWQGWQSQTLGPTAFEIVLVVPTNFPHREKLAALAGPTTRLAYADVCHDIGLCAVGATIARGKLLFFTESHCWPEPNVLEVCQEAFRTRSEFAGFSCASVRVCHNRLSVAEADMYNADIDFGMNVHPWRKILDQCFVTRREAYEACGGFDPDCGHFSEWLLAARYFARGQSVGYLPDARVHHHYVGSLEELKTFTLDFIAGEIRYFSRHSREPESRLLEAPPEWICRDNFAPDMARVVLRMCLREAAGGSIGAIRGIERWAIPALSGDRIVRLASSVDAAGARLAAIVAILARSQERLGRDLRRYIATLIRHQRLERIAAEGIERTECASESEPGAIVLTQTGFYPLEQYQGIAFRWSETEAAVRIRVRPGGCLVRVECLAVRSLKDADLRVYVDGKRAADTAVVVGADHCEIHLEARRSGIVVLGWVCRPLRAKDDNRRLGLPVVRIELA